MSPGLHKAMNPDSEKSQSLTGVAAQIPGSSESYRFQKEQGEQLAAQCHRLTVSKTNNASKTLIVGVILIRLCVLSLCLTAACSGRLSENRLPGEPFRRTRE